MTLHKLGTAVLLAFGAAACSNKTDDANIAGDESVIAAEAANADVEILPPSEGNGVVAPAPKVMSANVIPSQYRGRWSMVPADCASTRGDNKGLITIGGTTIRFYEATATLKEQRPAIATSFSGQFAFNGEGQQWTKVETLTRTGDTLKRADDEGSFTYTRCA
ncbi:MAG: hypothetical protein ABI667_06335 [Sphingomicrobium sp.]